MIYVADGNKTYYDFLGTIKMDRTLPEKIVCKVTCNNHPVQGLTIFAILEADYKNNYGFIVGPTEENGCAELRREEILAMAEEELNLAIMDYGHIDKVFNGTVNLQIMTKDEIDGALQSYEFYKDFFKGFPPNHKEILKSAASTLEQIETKGLKLEASVEPNQIRVVISPMGQKIEPLKIKHTK